MTSQLTSDQRDLRDVLRRFVASRSPETQVRAAIEAPRGFDETLWRDFAGELGCCGLMAPEEYGGAGGSFIEVGLVLEQTGAALACLPYFSTVVLAQSALLAAGDAGALERWLPVLASGEVRATVAFAEPGDQWGSFGMATTAREANGGWAVSGVKTHVVDGASADLILVFAQAPDGLSLFAVESSAHGIAAQPARSLDLTRRQARIELQGVAATLVGAGGDAGPVLDRVMTVAAVGLAAEQSGGAARVLEMAVGYAGSRFQFGRAVGSFQAIKNKCVDMFIGAESSRVAARRAARAVADDSPELPVLASLSKAYCSDAYWAVACENIQVHGGIGFTWEHPAHLHYRRAESSKLLFGAPSFHRELLAARIGA
jgi:alkylation response protein AidB-like acyl-CoA dehydrogenase